MEERFYCALWIYLLPHTWSIVTFIVLKNCVA